MCLFLVFLSFRFNKNARVEKIRNFFRNVEKIEMCKETSKS